MLTLLAVFGWLGLFAFLLVLGIELLPWWVDRTLHKPWSRYPRKPGDF